MDARRNAGLLAFEPCAKAAVRSRLENQRGSASRAVCSGRLNGRGDRGCDIGPRFKFPGYFRVWKVPLWGAVIARKSCKLFSFHALLDCAFLQIL